MVEVEDPGGVPYYWNYLTGATVYHLDADTRPKWRARRDPQGKYFWQDLEEEGRVLRKLPGTATASRDDGRDDVEVAGREGWIQPGAALALSGLQQEQHLNEQVVEVQCFEGRGRAVVRLPRCLGGRILAVRPANLVPLPRGSLVELRPAEGEQRGEAGKVLGLEPGWRYLLRMADNTNCVVLASEVLSRCRLLDLDPSAPLAPTLRRKIQERRCTFLDSRGLREAFSVHFPPRLQAALSARRDGATEPLSKWPLLMYMHGAGGGAFFADGIKQIHTAGMRFAAEEFIVVSPHCHWRWKEQPKPWVTELVLALRAASWVDPSRIYLTGCSMGGMGCWELGAARPDLYAGLAPVAAHHNAQHTERLASQLRGLPIFVAHSRDDETCAFEKEEPLWRRLREFGNERLQVNVISGAKHYFVYERTYCDTIALYAWLLSFRRVEAGDS